MEWLTTPEFCDVMARYRGKIEKNYKNSPERHPGQSTSS
jgi:hypothetical protein